MGRLPKCLESDEAPGNISRGWQVRTSNAVPSYSRKRVRAVVEEEITADKETQRQESTATHYQSTSLATNTYTGVPLSKGAHSVRTAPATAERFSEYYDRITNIQQQNSRRGPAKSGGRKIPFGIESTAPLQPDIPFLNHHTHDGAQPLIPDFVEDEELAQMEGALAELMTNMSIPDTEDDRVLEDVAEEYIHAGPPHQELEHDENERNTAHVTLEEEEAHSERPEVVDGDGEKSGV